MSNFLGLSLGISFYQLCDLGQINSTFLDLSVLIHQMVHLEMDSNHELSCVFFLESWKKQLLFKTDISMFSSLLPALFSLSSLRCFCSCHWLRSQYLLFLNRCV